ncbi:MAG: Hsp20/alpha crystallin family protein [Caldilineaceae bacterium SB0665_bin_25]|nr:Hsp20/alpha crystallin family protein [Caldilineaceae bacterium SB0665_bin_25]
MSRIVRWDPFREMISVRNQMDQIVGDLFQAPAGWQGNGDGDHIRLALDVSEDDNGYSVKASLPGINPADLEISFSENSLTIRGETQAESVEENAKWHLRERSFGRFMRSITMPAAVNADDISADYEDGVLTLTLPKAEEVRPRIIAVRGSGEEAVAA